MDELDRKLHNDLNLKIEIPDKLDTIIKEGLNRKKRYYLLPKIAMIACSTIVVTAGIVYAGTIVYDKIWQEPQKIVGFNTEENQNINTEEVMTQEKAIQIAKDILEKFGYKEENIESIELQNNSSNYESNWVVKTKNNVYISFESKKGESFEISNNDILYKDIKKFRTTEKDAEKTAREICKKYGYDLNEYGYTKITSNMNSEEESYIWNVEFYKEYDGLINPYEGIGVSFIPKINEIYSFGITNRKFENNPIEITKEEAKEIALKEEEKIDIKYTIENINIELNIVSMNGVAYLRTNDYNQLQEQTSGSYPSEKWEYYRTNNRIRKAWIVTIIYNIPKSIDKSYNRNDKQFSYYIDATTGEIIGGSSIYKLYSKK